MNKEEYKKYLKTDHWKCLKAKKYASLKYTSCQFCNTATNLDVHHINYRNIYDCKVEDLLVLCRDCHFAFHKVLKNERIFYLHMEPKKRLSILRARFLKIDTKARERKKASKKRIKNEKQVMAEIRQEQEHIRQMFKSF